MMTREIGHRQPAELPGADDRPVRHHQPHDATGAKITMLMKSTPT